MERWIHIEIQFENGSYLNLNPEDVQKIIKAKLVIEELSNAVSIAEEFMKLRKHSEV